MFGLVHANEFDNRNIADSPCSLEARCLHKKGKRIEQGKGLPDPKTGWRGSPAPGNEAAAAGYVRIALDAKIFTPEPGPDAKKSQRDHWNKSDYKTADKAKRFIDTITQPESYWWAGGE